MTLGPTEAVIALRKLVPADWLVESWHDSDSMSFCIKLYTPPMRDNQRLQVSSMISDMQMITMQADAVFLMLDTMYEQLCQDLDDRGYGGRYATRSLRESISTVANQKRASDGVVRRRKRSAHAPKMKVEKSESGSGWPDPAWRQAMAAFIPDVPNPNGWDLAQSFRVPDPLMEPAPGVGWTKIVNDAVSSLSHDQLRQVMDEYRQERTR